MFNDLGLQHAKMGLANPAGMPALRLHGEEHVAQERQL